MAAVVLEHLTKVYPNGIQAVRDLNLQVAEGEFLVLVGPSGCGKTTTLRLIAGLEEPTAGNISIGGYMVNTLPPHERDVAMVFQRSTLYPHMNVRRNLLIGLQMRRRRGSLARLVFRWCRRHRYTEVQEQQRLQAESIAGAAHLLGLEDVMDRLPSQLSGGQQQRVALGRTIVRRPGVFLLDEPLSNLDGPLRAELRHELHLLQRRLRATMMYVTHDQAEAMMLADRVAVMDGGVVQQVDRPLTIYERPSNRFVAGFLGWPPMNFIDGQLVPKDGRLCFAGDSWSAALPPAKAARWETQIGRTVTLGIRPEDIRLGIPVQGETTVAMEVLLIEPLGHANLVTLGRGEWQGIALSSGAAAGSGWKRLRQKEMVEVSFDMEHAHLFDGATGLALNNSRPAG